VSFEPRVWPVTIQSRHQKYVGDLVCQLKRYKMAFPALSSQSVFLLSILSVIFEPWKAQSCLDLHVHNRIKSDKISPGMSERSYSTTTSITHGSPRSSAYSISSQSSRGSDTMGYEERSSYSLRVPVTEAQGRSYCSRQLCVGH